MNNNGLKTITITEAREIITEAKNVKDIKSRQNYYWGIFEIDIIYLDDTFKEITIDNKDNADINKILGI